MRTRGAGRCTEVNFLWLLAFAIAAVYLVVFVVQFPRSITQLGWNPSVASAYLIPETLAKTGTSGFTAMGSTGMWAALWFGLATARLPLHRELWEIAPTALFVLTGLIVGWSVAQLAGRRAAALAVLVCVVVSPLALAFFIAPWAHNLVYPCTALLGAYLIWLARGEGRRRIVALAVPPLLGVVVGACLASDFLLAATGVIPLALAGALAGMRRERRSRLVAASAFTTVAVAIPIAKLTSTTMRSLGYQTLPTPFKIAPLAQLPARAKLLFKGLKILFNGYLGPEAPGTMHAELGLASDVVMSMALLTLLVVGALAAAGFIGSGLRKSTSQTPALQARSLHIIYWVASTVVACAAFWIAGEGPITTHESYYATAIFSVAAVLPLLLGGHALARWLIAAGATVLFAAALAGMSGGWANRDPQIASSGPLVLRIARANDVTAGYSNWADASGLTWGLHNRVTVRPVIECSNPSGADVCPGFQAFVPSWYEPRQRRSFLLVEANGVDHGAPPKGLGKPRAEYAFEGMRMYIYPYDIASRFGPFISG